MIHFQSARSLALKFMPIVVGALPAVVACTPMLLPSAAVAQSSTIATATIPFDFRMGTGKMPAGKYVIVKVNDHILTLRNADLSVAENVMVFQGDGPKASESSKLLFHHLGTQFYLTDVKLANTRSYRLPKSRAEKEALIATEVVTHSSTTEVALNTLPR